MGYIADYKKWRALFEQSSSTASEVSMFVYASTSVEKMPNSENVKNNGLVEPEDKTKFPDIEKTVYTATVREFLASKNLSVFKPVRTTSTPMDVLKIGTQGKDYVQGATTGAITFMTSSTEVIEASHNGLLVLARALDTYIDAGKPNNTKIILKMGQTKRYGTTLNLKSIERLNLKKQLIGQWGTYLVVSLIGDAYLKPTSNEAKLFIGQPLEKRIELAKQWMAAITHPLVPNSFRTGRPDPTAFITKWYGESGLDPAKLTDATLVSEWKALWNKEITSWNTDAANAVKLWKTIVDVPIPALDEIFKANLTTYVGDPAAKAAPVLASEKPLVSVPGKSVPGGAAKVSTGQYDLGKSKN